MRCNNLIRSKKNGMNELAKTFREPAVDRLNSGPASVTCPWCGAASSATGGWGLVEGDSYLCQDVGRCGRPSRVVQAKYPTKADRTAFVTLEPDYEIWFLAEVAPLLGMKGLAWLAGRAKEEVARRGLEKVGGGQGPSTPSGDEDRPASGAVTGGSQPPEEVPF